jgi:ribonucleoside-diphosphate reductase alpha chain
MTPPSGGVVLNRARWQAQKGEGMTETVSGSTARRGKGGRKGLKMERIFTTPGVHPYDELRWERRDVVMTNWRDGSVNFEQRGVEFPDFWSLNAVNIVTSKYFRGAVGTPQREWSLRQLVDRVVQMYVDTGKDNGYFGSDAEAEIFEHELKYALVHQMFSFNSPVWFNVGTKSPQQVSACLPYDGRPDPHREARRGRRGRHQGVRRAGPHPHSCDQGQRG